MNPVPQTRFDSAAAADRRSSSAGTSVFDRRYAALAAAVLALAAFNLFFRLGAEIVSEWDESIYALTAAEMLASGDWIGTTFNGALDYYNTKPPLQVWLITLSFKVFGVGLVPLRLVSALAAWLTVGALMWWARRLAGAAVSLLSGVVLATCFAFLHEHAGRSANTDAIFTLLILLSVVAIWAADARGRWHVAWIGPIVAAAFLLRGMAILMPVLLVAIVLASGGWARLRAWRAPLLTGLAVAAVPVGAWMLARYQLDGWAFLGRLFWFDFVARSATALEGHAHGPLFYLDILQKHHYDWLLAAAAALLLAPPALGSVRLRQRLAGAGRVPVLLAAWAAVTLLLPTLMQTKLPWYLNPFYPLFAMAVAFALARAGQRLVNAPRWRQVALAGVAILMFGVAETKFVWYSYHYRNPDRSDQAIVLEHQARLAGRVLFRDRQDAGGLFVARWLVGADARYAADLDMFLSNSRIDDYFVTSAGVSHADVELIGSSGGYSLFRRCEPGPPSADSGPRPPG